MLSLKKINAYLSNVLDARTISDEIGDITKPKLGGSVSITLEEDYEIIFTEIYAVKMLNDYIDGVFKDYQLSYLCDCLLLSEKVIFTSKVVEESVEEMTDFEINGYLTKDKAMGIIKILSTY